jgi:hypothetical protein
MQLDWVMLGHGPHPPHSSKRHQTPERSKSADEKDKLDWQADGPLSLCYVRSISATRNASSSDCWVFSRGSQAVS